MIRSKLFSGLVPGIKTMADEIGPFYKGIVFYGPIIYNTPHFKYSQRSTVKRIMCSCGYEAATMDSTFNEYNPECPHCRGPLMRLDIERSGDNHLSFSAFNMRVKKNVLEICDMTVNVTPHIVTTTAPNMDQAVENLKEMDLEVKNKVLYSIEKDPKGHMTIKTSLTASAGIYRGINPHISQEARDFLGEQMVEALKDRYGTNVLNFDLNFFEAAQAFPEIFANETLKKNLDGISDVVSLYAKSDKYAWDGSKIPSTVTIEEFFDKKGYPPQLFPSNSSGRQSLTYDRDVYLKFMDTDVGKIVTNRIANGVPFSCQTVDEIVYVSMAKKMGLEMPRIRYHYSYPVEINNAALDGYEDLFLPFFKDAVDQYSSDELAVLFVQRLSQLRSRALAAPTEDTVRTRTYSSLINEQTFISKTSADITADMSKDPLGTLCSLRKRPNEEN